MTARSPFRRIVRTCLRWLALAAGAVLVNVVLFLVLTRLSGDHVPERDEFDPIGVTLVNLEPPAPPATETRKEPEPPPPPPPRLDFTPELAPPSLDPGSLDLGVPLTLDLGDLGAGLGDLSAVFDASELDARPEALVRLAPPYPLRAQQRGIEGVVRVRLLVNAEGRVEEVHILEAQPEGWFEDTVERAAPTWTFSPGRIGGENVASWVVTNVRFTLGR